MRIRVALTIDAPPEVVWREVESIERHVDWMTDAVSITFTGPLRRGVGTRFDCVTRIGPFRTTDRMTVTQWTPRRALGIEHHGAVTGRGRFTLSRRRRDRTHFTWTEKLKFPWWMGGPVGALAAKPILRAVWRRNLYALKHLVEGSNYQGPSSGAGALPSSHSTRARRSALSAKPGSRRRSSPST